MYIDYYLKFTDNVEATQVLFNEGIPKYNAIDVIGEIYKTNEEGSVIVLPGWHVNVRHTEEAPELDQYKVNPKPLTPARMWF